MTPFTWFLVLYISSAFGGLSVVWLHFDRSEKRSFEYVRRRKVFHCVRCGSLYSVRKGDVSQGEMCPNCDYKNYELTF